MPTQLVGGPFSKKKKKKKLVDSTQFKPVGLANRKISVIHEVIALQAKKKKKKPVDETVQTCSFDK